MWVSSLVISATHALYSRCERLYCWHLESGLTLGSVARHVRKVVQVELSTLPGPGPFRSPKRQKLKSWKPQLRHLSDKAIFHRDPSSLSDLEGNGCIFVWLFHLIDCWWHSLMIGFYIYLLVASFRSSCKAHSRHSQFEYDFSDSIAPYFWLRSHSLSYHIISYIIYHIKSYHIIWYHIISYHIISIIIFLDFMFDEKTTGRQWYLVCKDHGRLWFWSWTWQFWTWTSVNGEHVSSGNCFSKSFLPHNANDLSFFCHGYTPDQLQNHYGNQW